MCEYIIFSNMKRYVSVQQASQIEIFFSFFPLSRWKAFSCSDNGYVFEETSFLSSALCIWQDCDVIIVSIGEINVQKNRFWITSKIFRKIIMRGESFEYILAQKIPLQNPVFFCFFFGAMLVFY